MIDRQFYSASMSRKRPWQDEFPPLGLKRSSGDAQMDEIEDQEFEHQLTEEILSCLLPPSESWRYDLVWRDVRVSLHKTLLVPFTLHRFGSSATGLAFTGSDIDLCLEVLQPSPRPLLNAVQAALRYHRYQFTSVLALRGARVPIVKFRHLRTGIYGDISFTGTLAVRNTELIRLLCSMDPRVKPLLALTKRWAIVQGVANQDGDVHRLSSYALILMAVFYLQTRQILPPIAALQARCPRKEFQLGWECSFAPMPWTKRLPNVSIRDIVVGFFLFYAEFPFNEDVICPLLGRPVPRSAFLEASTLPPEMAAYADRIVPAIKETNNDPAANQTNKNTAAGQTVGPDLANRNTSTDTNNKSPMKKKMKQAGDQTNEESSEDNTNKNQSVDQTNPSASQTNDSSENQTKKSSSEGQTKEGTSAAQPKKATQPKSGVKTQVVGLSLAHRAICVQDPFALDHNVVRGQIPSSFERFAKVLTHAADVCKKTSGSTFLPELLTPLPTTKVILTRTLRRSLQEGPADKWSSAATEVAQRILETVLALRLEPLPIKQPGTLSFSCAAHHDVMQNRNAALSECKGVADLSPVQLQARATARMLVVTGPSRVALANFSISLQPGEGPSLAIAATAEESGLKAANNYVNFLMSGLMKWIPAELRYMALTDSLKVACVSGQSKSDEQVAEESNRVVSGQNTKKKKKKKKRKMTASQTPMTLPYVASNLANNEEQAEMAKIQAIMAKVERETTNDQPTTVRVQNKMVTRQPTAASMGQNEMVISQLSAVPAQNKMGVSGSVIVYYQPTTAIGQSDIASNQPAATRVQNEFAKNQPTATRVQNEVAKNQPSATRVQSEIAKTQPTTARVQSEIAKNQPAATRVQNDVAKNQPTTNRVQSEMAKSQPAATRVQSEIAKTQPTTNRVQSEIAKNHPIAAKAQNEIVRNQPMNTRGLSRSAKNQPTPAKTPIECANSQPMAAKAKGDEARSQPTTAQVPAADPQTAMTSELATIRHKSDWKRQRVISATRGLL